MKRSLVFALLAISSLAFSQQQSQKPPIADEKDDEFQEQRREWFYGLRAFPKEEIPLGARAAAIKQLDRMLRGARATAKAPGRALSTTAWTSIGPRSVNSQGLPYASGRVSALAVDPRNADTVFLGGADGGVWKSVDGGKNWKALTDDQASLAIGALALDPTNPDVVYAGTGDPNGYSGAGILKSPDGGNTWTNIVGPFADARIGGIAIHPTNGQLLLAAKTSINGKNDGIYRSTNAGATWTQVLAGSGFSVTLNASGIAYAALISDGTKGGVYKSVDSGATWAAANGSGATALPFATSSGIRMAVAPSNASLVVVSLANPTRALMGVYKSLDGGTTWNAIAGWPDYCAPQCNYSNIVAIHPTNTNLIYTGGALNTYRTIDGGKTITEAFADNGSPHSDIVHVDEQSFAFSSDGGRIYLGTDGGVASTSSFDQDAILWTTLNASLTLTQFYPGISIHPSNINIGFGGTQDNSTERYSGSLVWDTTVCGDGGQTAIDYNNPSNVYAACTQAKIMKSTDGGSTFTESDAGIQGGIVAFIAPLQIDPVDPTRLYFGTDKVQQTTDGAKTWTAISPSIGPSNPINAIGVGSDSNTVYAATQTGKLSVSRNASAGVASTWTDRSKGLPGRAVTAISVDPNNPLNAVVAVSGFNSNTPGASGHVFKTSDAGATWTDISAPLPDIPVDDVVIDPDIANTIYVGTDLGAFYTTNGGTAWSVLGTGLPRVAVTGLKLHRQARILRAATFGRGMWDISVPAPAQNPLAVLASLVPSIAAPASGAFTLTINGTGFVSASTVKWNGSARPATVVSPTTITASITAADVAAAGAAVVTVLSPVPGGGTSNGLAFTIGATIPAPALVSVSPASVAAGGGNYTLTVTGTGFVSGSTLTWNGSQRATSPLSSTQLSATITAADIASATTANVAVTNPTPGGGTSNALSEFVTGTPSGANFAGAFWTFTGAGVNAATVPMGTVTGLNFDTAGNLYISDGDNCLIYKLTPAGAFSTAAGTGTCGGYNSRYRLGSPAGIAFDAAGNTYAADTLAGQRIVKLNADGTLTVVAGNGQSGNFGDGGPATAASIGQSFGVAFDAAGNMYIAGSFDNRVRKVDTSGKITTIAGNGAFAYSGDGGPSTAAGVSQPYDITVDAKGNIYFVESGNADVRKIAPDGTISTFAGVGGVNGSGFAGDGGPARSAHFSQPKGLALDAAGNMYIADTLNNRIRKVDVASGNVSTIAGTGVASYTGDGGPATSAALNAPQKVAVDASGNIYIADSGNRRVRKILGGIITTIVGSGGYKFSGDGGAAATANFNAPQGVASDGQGNIYVADTGNNRVRKINSSGVVSTVAGTGAGGFSGDGGQATSAALNGPRAVTLDAQGNLYVADTQNNRVRKVTPAGLISTVLGGGNSAVRTGVAATSASVGPVNTVLSDGVNVYFSSSCAIYRIGTDGNLTVVADATLKACVLGGEGGPATTAGFGLPTGLTLDAPGNLYFTENVRVHKVSTAGIITTLAGGGSTYNADGSLGTGIQMNQVAGITGDASGNLYFSDSLHNDRVYLLSPTGNLTTVAGGGEFHAPVNVTLSQPHGVAVDAQGNLFIADTGNDRIVKVSGVAASGTIVVTPPTGGSTGGNPPAVTAAGIVNGASFSTDNIVSPWSIASLFGVNLSTGTGGASTIPLPVTLNNTQLLVNNVAAPLYFTASSQINFQIPVEATIPTSILSVTSPGGASNSVPMKLLATSPGIFSASPGGTGQGAVLNSDSSANNAGNPAARGSIIQIFVTGLGLTTPPVSTGKPGAIAAPFNVPNAQPTVIIGGIPAELIFYAAAPGYVGLYQVNATVPPNISIGNIPLLIQSGGRTSNIVTIAVK